MTTCPRCQSACFVQPKNEDGDYDCLQCGERWVSETRREWLDRIRRESHFLPEPPVKLGRPSTQSRVLSVLSTTRPMTTSEVARALNLREGTVIGVLWGLQRSGLIAVHGLAGGGHLWVLSPDLIAEAS